MFEFLLPTTIVLGISYTIYKLFELFARRKERMTLIEKINSCEGISPSLKVPDLFLSSIPKFGALRIGLMLTGLGLGLAIAIILNYLIDWQNMVNAGKLPNQYGEILYFALMLLFGGLGLTKAYMVEQKSLKKN